MKVISIFNNKGGVGKTTSAQNIGAALAKYANKRTLLIDLDQQSNLTMSLGVKTGLFKHDTGTFILGESSLDDTKIKYRDTLLDLIPASQNLITRQSELSTKNYPISLKNALIKISDRYDYVIIDCPPMISTFSDIALMASDKYYVPMQAEYFSYEGLRNLVSYASNLKKSIQNSKKNIEVVFELGGIFAVGFNPLAKASFNKMIMKSIEEQMGSKFLKSYIRTCVALSEAQAKGLTIFDYNEEYKRGMQAANDYHSLTKEIVETL
jgi:chromosome partitioning protein